MADLVRDTQATAHTVTCRKGRWCDGFSCRVRIRAEADRRWGPLIRIGALHPIDPEEQR